MNVKNTIAAALAILVVGFFFVNWPSATDMSLGYDDSLSSDVSNDVSTDGASDIVVVRSVNADGSFNFSGSVSLPTPCHELSTDIRIAESYPEQIFATLTSSTDAYRCEPAVTSFPFSFSARVSEDATLSVSLNGAPLRVTLADAPL